MSLKEFLLKFLQLYKGKIENKIIRAFLTAGTACIIAAGSPNFLIPLIFELLNQYLKTEFDIPTFNINYIVLVILLLMGIFFYGCAICFYVNTKKKQIISKLLKIRHSSIESSNTIKTDSDYSSHHIEIINIDQKLEMSNISKHSIERALYIQEKEVKKIIQSTDGNDYVDIEYYGLAHIPLVILLGFQIADKLNTKLHEWNQNKSQWELIGSNNRSFPPLLLEKNNHKQVHQNVTEVVVKIGLTYLIPEENLEGLNLHHLNSYYLHLEKPHRNNIINIEQLQKYKEEFRKLLDEINQNYIKLEKVHLFYSGQPSFAYCIGSTITPRMDKEIIIYNYVGSEFPQYNWHLNLKKVDQHIEVGLTKEQINRNV